MNKLITKIKANGSNHMKNPKDTHTHSKNTYNDGETKPDQNQEYYSQNPRLL